MLDTMFSQSITELAKSIQYRVKFDDIITSIVDLDKAEKMVAYLTNAGLNSDLWEMRIGLIAIELMNQDIYDDESALEYIGKLHAGK